MSVKTKASTIAFVVALAGAAAVATTVTQNTGMKGFINSSDRAKGWKNYDDGPNRITVQLTYGTGQFAGISIKVNQERYTGKILDATKDSRVLKKVLHAKPGDVIDALIAPQSGNSGSSCYIHDDKHPELDGPPAVMAVERGLSHCKMIVKE